MSYELPIRLLHSLPRQLSGRWENALERVRQQLGVWLLAPPSCDQAVADALRQQYEQERLVNQVATQIRQSFDLPVILETAIQEIQRILQADRLLIFQFFPALAELPQTVPSGLTPADGLPLSWGRVIHEAKSSDRIATILTWSPEDACFAQVPDCLEKYRKGFVQAVDDITVTYADHPCMQDLMRRADVRSKLVVPIVVQDGLWGLLIAHHCTEVRHWQESESTFIGRVSELLAIAIQQTQLYTQLQDQAYTLEERVIDRTQELRDALVAAQSANQVKTEFLAMMSHELRTPLTCIIGMANTLQRLPAGEEGERFLPKERQQEYLKTIQQSGEHLLEVINDILDLTQLEAGRMGLDISEFSLFQVASESLRMLRSQAMRKKIHLVFDCPESVYSLATAYQNDSFLADPRRVRQILLNLLTNAIKFTPEGGRVTLSVWKEDDQAVLQVQDTGIGIPPEQRPLLFQKFQQLDMSRQRGYEGTGLGLALTKHLVDLHGGWIEVESTVGKGSIFRVWLPPQTVVSDRLVEADSPTVTNAQGQGQIVLVEDEDATATLICELLTAAGYQVVWLIKGSTILQQIEILQPLAVLLNIDLTWVNADQVLTSLKQNPLTQQIAVLALTYAPQAQATQTGQSVGADDTLTLPISKPENLLNKVATLVNPQRVSS